MPTHVARLRLLVSALLIVSAVLFAIGGMVERSQRQQETGGALAIAKTQERASPAPATAATGESGGESGGEASPHTSGEAGRESSAVGSETLHRDSSEQLLGVNPESTGLTVAGIVAAIALALGGWLVRRRAVWLAVVAFGLVFAAADGRELAHQIAESRPSVAAIAAVLIVLHLAVAAGAVALIRGWSRPPAPTVTESR